VSSLEACWEKYPGSGTVCCRDADTPRREDKNVSAWFHAGAMKEEAAAQQALKAGQTEYHVHYLDAESGHIGHETFDVLAEAERFADSKLVAPECWATVDAVPAARESRLVA
jgi:hypothetical protein